jgi:hypothetical protein
VNAGRLDSEAQEQMPRRGQLYRSFQAYTFSFGIQYIRIPSFILSICRIIENEYHYYWAGRLVSGENREIAVAKSPHADTTFTTKK